MTSFLDKNSSNLLLRKHLSKLLLTVLLVASVSTLDAQGYYKDIFMDGGIRLTSRKDLPAARRLGLSIEHLITTGRGRGNSPHTAQDTIMQDAVLRGSEIDHNGVLLYPDGEPRFKMVYVNGGLATAHARSLGDKGRDNFITFVENGGSYVGTCAGMFMATLGNSKKFNIPQKIYLHIWPGVVNSTGLSRTPTGFFIEPGSALLNYYDFGGDMYIDSVYHNGGGFIYQPEGLPEGTEILTRYDYKELTKDGTSIHNEISSWAYKANEGSGRVVLTGSHPEAVGYGERLDLMSALLLYAIDGVGTTKIKGELIQGESRIMDKSTLDNDPAYTKIGDKQYHHFTVEIPEGAKNIVIELKGSPRYDLNLYLAKDTPAFVDKASYLDITRGGAKKIEVESLEPGTWYVAVECATTVETVLTKWGHQYEGDLSVLNGVPYTISVNWK